MIFYIGIYFNLAFLIFCVDSSSEGDMCSKSGVIGKCTNVKNCQSAIDDLKRKIIPQLCGFSGEDPVVCCLDNQVTTARSTVLTTSTIRSQSTSGDSSVFVDYKDTDSFNGSGCGPVRRELTSPKRGQKAFDKCLEYQEKLVYSCVQSILSGDMVRGNDCWHNSNELIVGGSHSSSNEFPHMVLLGYGESAELAQWLCEGSVISDRFILTAGHCTTIRPSGALAFIRHGALNRSEPLYLSRVYNLKRIIRHPEYKPPLPYNDIALLETETTMELSQFLVPGCLQVDAEENRQVTVTGWEVHDGINYYLQKTSVIKTTKEECSEKLQGIIKKRGLNDTTQVCYKHESRAIDLCLEGPLQVESKQISCMYVIVGVTSFSRACGLVDTPGVYTRIVPFVPWIESIVWP